MQPQLTLTGHPNFTTSIHKDLHLSTTMEEALITPTTSQMSNAIILSHMTYRVRAPPCREDLGGILSAVKEEP